MSGAPTPVHVVVHTHWDREWYLTQQATAQRLVKVVQRLVALLDRHEAAALPAVLLDGQTVLLEDLRAEAEPALWARVQQHLRTGRLQVGPWYVAADEFLCSGEALLRNLEIGTTDARAAGSHRFVGYLPDTFGHAAQMPQLLRQFGIDGAVVWRGVDLAQAEFDWQAPDGSAVGAIFLPEGYYQHAFNPPDGAAATRALLQRLATRTASGLLLLPQGGDHLQPALDLVERVAAFNAGQSDFTLTLADLAGTVQTLLTRSSGRRPVLRGELRSNAQAFVLPDVLSTRRPLKQAYQQLESRLLGATEPLAACWTPAHEVPWAALDRTWRELLQQTAHDSACGCSTDAVHREMALRFERLAQRLEALEQRLCAEAGLVQTARHEPGPPGARAVFGDDSRFTLWNPWPQRLAGWHALEPLVEGPAWQGLRVRHAESGALLPSVTLGATPARELRSPLDEFPDPVVGHRWRLWVRADLAGLQALPLVLEPVESVESVEPVEPEARPPQQALPALSPWLDNGAIALGLDPQGRLVLRQEGRTLTAVLALQHELDAGDSYNHSPPPERAQRRQESWRCTAVRRAGALQELALHTTLTVPASLSDDRQGPAASRVTLQAALILRLFDGEDQVEADLVLDNPARDQRLRLVWAAGAPDEQHLATDSAMAWIDRPCVHERLPVAPSRQEMAVAVFPSWQALVAGPWWVAHEALNEVAMLPPPAPHDGPRLALTLLRSVGWLSRRDLLTRGVGAGPDLPVPEAQGLGQHRYRFRFGLAGTPEQGRQRALAAARALHEPALRLPGHGQPLREGFDIGNAVVQVAALRPRPEPRQTNPAEPPGGSEAAAPPRAGGAHGAAAVLRELRLWNPSAQAQALTLDAARWQVVRADGTPLPGADPCEVAPHAIVTLRERAR